MALYTPADGGPGIHRDEAARGTRDAQSVPAKVLRAEHPLYVKYAPTWYRCLDLYEGNNLQDYLFRHRRESPDSFAGRLERLSYRNYSAPVVDLYVHYIFSKQIMRRSEGKLTPIWEEFHKNVDRKRTTLDRFMRDVAGWALCFGHCFVLVDAPKVTRPPASEQERIDAGQFPYFTIYFPTEATNWEVDEDGELLWIRFREPITGDVGPFDVRDRGSARSIEDSSETAVMRRRGDVAIPQNAARVPRPPRAIYRTWTREEWFVHRVRGDQVDLLDRGTHPVGEVPVVRFYNKQMARQPFLGVSLVHDIVRLNQRILDLDSLIDEATFQQTINLLCMQQQPDGADEITLGNNNVFEYWGDRPPFFLTPTTAPLAYMESRIQGIREEIYRLAKLGGGMGLEPRSVPSGVSAAFEFNETNRTLAEHADEFEAGEERCHHFWFAWQGQERVGSTDYPDDFAVQSFQEELAMITQVGSTIRSPTLRRELEKKAAKRLHPNAEPEVSDQIAGEIDFIPESVSTFSGPYFFDPLTQQVKSPMDPNPIGFLGEIVAARQAENPLTAGGDPAQQAAEERVTGVPHDGVPRAPQPKGPPAAATTAAQGA